MHVFEMVVWIVIVGCIAGVISDYLKTRRKEMASGNVEALDDAMDRIDELEDRIRVLEKIVTDNRYNLSREIDDLAAK